MPHFLKSGAGRTGIPQAIERNTCSASVKTAREQSEEVVGYSKMPNQSGCLVELIEVSQRDPVYVSGFRSHTVEPCSKIEHGSPNLCSNFEQTPSKVAHYVESFGFGDRKANTKPGRCARK